MLNSDQQVGNMESKKGAADWDEIGTSLKMKVVHVSSTNADHNSEMPPSGGERIADDAHSKDSVELQCRCTGGVESVFSGDRSVDERNWGAFDTHYDTDLGGTSVLVLQRT
ncbi:unnamed protein product [Camellia sinensis]